MTGPHPSEQELGALIEGALAADERGALESHAEACLSCRGDLATMRRGLDALRAETRRLGTAPPLLVPPRSRQDPARTGLLRRLGIAAAAAAAIAVGAWWIPRRGPVASVAWARGTAPAWAPGRPVRGGEELSTGAGTTVGLRFANGAEVAWNRETRARAVSASEVALLAGEIHVRVPAEAKGFSVETPQGRLVDLGTAFLARVEGGRTRAHVLLGTVRAESRRGPRDLKEGERAVLGDGIEVEAVPPPEADASLAWMREALFASPLRRVPLPALLDRIESVTPYRFDVDRAAVGDATVSGSLSGVSSSATVGSLQRTLGWPSERNGFQVRIHVPPSERR